jgi:hypothetical protein
MWWDEVLIYVFLGGVVDRSYRPSFIYRWANRRYVQLSDFCVAERFVPNLPLEGGGSTEGSKEGPDLCH